MVMVKQYSSTVKHKDTGIKDAKAGTVLVEYRYKKDGGTYTVMPGSMHKSGELIEWTNQIPIEMHQGKLHEKVETLAGVALLCRYYNEGSRQSWVLGATALLLKCGIEKWEEILEFIIRGDDEPEMRLKAVALTKTKFDSDPNRIATKSYLLEAGISVEVLDRIFELLNYKNVDYIDLEEGTIDSDLPKQPPVKLKDRLKYLIYVEPLDVAYDLTTGTKTKQSKFNANFKEYSLGKNGKRGPLSAWEKFVKEAPQCETLGYFPNNYKLSVGGEVNTWKPNNNIEAIEGDVSLYKQWLAGLCDGDVDISFQLEQWMAYAITGTEKAAWGPLFIGGQGTGKSTFATILTHILGEQNAIGITGSRLLSEFNSILESRRVVVVEELDTLRKGFDKIKDLITNNRVLVNPKGVAQYFMKQPTMYAFSTNSMSGLDFGKDTRRLLVILSKSHNMNAKDSIDWVHDFGEVKHGFYRELYNWLGNDKGYEKIYYHLTNNIDLTEFDPMRLGDNLGAGLDNIIAHNRTDIIDWLNDIDIVGSKGDSSRVFYHGTMKKLYMEHSGDRVIATKYFKNISVTTQTMKEAGYQVVSNNNKAYFYKKNKTITNELAKIKAMSGKFDYLESKVDKQWSN